MIDVEAVPHPIHRHSTAANPIDLDDETADDSEDSSESESRDEDSTSVSRFPRHRDSSEPPDVIDVEERVSKKRRLREIAQHELVQIDDEDQPLTSSQSTSEPAQRSTDASLSSSSKDYGEPPKDIVSDLLNKLHCPICFRNYRRRGDPKDDVQFLMDSDEVVEMRVAPCGHVYCATCCARMKECAICRRKIGPRQAFYPLHLV
eukprot:Selendium_serpulae@DN5982_c0_g1_i2.p1